MCAISYRTCQVSMNTITANKRIRIFNITVTIQVVSLNILCIQLLVVRLNYEVLFKNLPCSQYLSSSPLLRSPPLEMKDHGNEAVHEDNLPRLTCAFVCDVSVYLERHDSSESL